MREEHTITAEVQGSPISPISTTDEALESVYDALVARGDLVGPAVSADEAEGRIFVTACVVAASDREARQILTRALGESMVEVGLISSYMVTSVGYVTA